MNVMTFDKDYGYRYTPYKSTLLELHYKNISTVLYVVPTPLKVTQYTQDTF